MAAAASIRFNGVVTPLESLSVGSGVTLTNASNTDVVSWSWVFVSKPPGSAATIATPTASSASFTADVEGSYLVRLVVNDTLPDEDQDTGVARIKTLNLGLTPFAFDETGEGDPTHGWAKGWRASYLLLDKALGLSEYRTVKYVGAGGVGPLLLRLDDALGANANGDVIPAAEDWLNNSNQNETFLWEDGAIATGDVVRVLVRGLTIPITETSGVAVGDTLYAQLGGGLDKTPGTVDNVPSIGRVLDVSGGTMVLYFAVRPSANYSSLPIASQPDGTSETGGLTTFALSDHKHSFATSSATPTALDATGGAAGTSGSAPSRADHRHEILAGEPSNISVDGSNDSGSADELVRADHIHALDTYSTTPEEVDDSAGDPGGAGTVARGDHVHAHGNRAGGSLHALATPTDDGFMSAGDKDKLNVASMPNAIINSRFDFRQYGTTATLNAAGGGPTREYNVFDRWAAFSDLDGAADPAVTLERIATGGGGPYPLFPYVCRITRPVGDTSTQRRGILQEVDRRMVERMRGSFVTLHFFYTFSGNFSGTGGMKVQVYCGTGAESQEVLGGYTGSTTPVDVTATGVSSGFEVGFQVPSDATTMAVVFSSVPSGTALSTDFVDVTGVSLAITGDQATRGAFRHEFAGGSYQGELELCRSFFNKSYDIDTDPGTATQLGVEKISMANVGDNFAYWSKRFPRMRITPTLKMYDPQSAATEGFQVSSDGSALAPIAGTPATLSEDTPDSISRALHSTLGAGVHIAYAELHWTLDAEI